MGACWKNAWRPRRRSGRRCSRWSAASPRACPHPSSSTRRCAAPRSPSRGYTAARARRPTVAASARAAGLSERQLRRRFERAVGYGPSTLARVLRFQRFLRRAHAPESRAAPLARLAAEAGYADQAHLARECRRLSGLSPSSLLATGATPAGEPTEP